MNKTLKEISMFFSIFNKNLIRNKNLVYGFAPSYLGLGLASNLKKGQTLIISQDVSHELKGSFTGQVSCKQLKDFKIHHAIVGHSESRKYFGYSDETINKKVKVCLANNIKPIVCIGESLTQYNKHQTKSVLAKQLKTIFKGVNSSKCIVAYEPIWAIGSGKTPSLQKINELCGYIKKFVKKTPVLYGGSVDVNNAKSIVSLKNVNGLLIGGASLCPHAMIKILRSIK